MEVIRRVYREDHEQFRVSVRRFMERECAPRQQAWNKEGEVDRETWLKAGREGMLCTTLPAEYGGGGGDFGHAAILAEELAYGGVSGLSIGLHSDIVAPYINRLGTEEQKMRWLPKVCAGEIILAIAMTEPGGGSDLKSVRTTAVREGDEYVINGSKTFITNGCVSDLVLVVCKTDPAAGAKGVSLIMVETNREGFRRGRKLEKVGMHAQDIGTVLRQRAGAGCQPPGRGEQGIHLHDAGPGPGAFHDCGERRRQGRAPAGTDTGIRERPQGIWPDRVGLSEHQVQAGRYKDTSRGLAHHGRLLHRRTHAA